MPIRRHTLPAARPGAAARRARGYSIACLLALATVVVSARAAHALDFFVDQATGDDAFSAVQAQSPATPWRTIGRALSVVAAGHTIRVKPGVYQQALQSRAGGVALVADGAVGTVVVAPPAARSALAITHPDVLVDGFVLRGGVHGIRAEGADGLVVRGTVAVGQSANGFSVITTSGVTIDGATAVSSGSRGILLDRTSGAYLRNNLVYDAAEWGIDLENVAASGPSPATSTGNVVAFNTIAYNGRAGGGGLRLRNAIAEVRDNVITANAPYGVKLDTLGSALQHNLVDGSAHPLSPPDYPLGPGSIGDDPLFVAPAGADGVLGSVAGWADDDFSLADPAAGQSGAKSPAIDAGSGDITARDIGGSTRSDRVPDDGIADLGRHAMAPPSLGPPEVPATAATYFVDAARGDDARSKVEAQSPTTPWRSIGRAIQAARPKDTVLVAPGTYPESVKSKRRGVRLQALGDAVVAPPAGAIGIQIEHPRIRVEGFTVAGGLHGIRAELAKGVIVRGCSARDTTGNGIMVVETKRALLDGNRVERAGGQGILLKRSERSYVRNNLVAGSADWGIHVDNGDPPLPRSIAGNVVAFNTVHDNGRALSTGGIRFQLARGEIRDNVVSDNRGAGIRTDAAPTLVHHNCLSGSTPAIDDRIGQPATAWANVASAPSFVAPGSGDYRLRQAAAGDATTSACVDAGSGAIGEADISGSTRRDGIADAGIADIGQHVGAEPVPRNPPPLAPTPTPTPAPTSSPTPTPTPAPGGGPLLHVDCATGDDGRTRAEAQSPVTPWRTIQRAASAGLFGDVIVVAPGTCRERVEIDRTGLTIRAASPLATTVEAPAGKNAFNVQRGDFLLEGFRIRSSFQGVLVAAAKSSETIERVVLRGLDVAPAGGDMLAANGIQVREGRAITIDSCVVRGAAQQGILLKRTSRAYVRNNLVHAVPNDWGISFDNTSTGPLPPLSTGNVAAFNTVSGCGAGLRFVNTAGELFANVTAFNRTIGLKFDQGGEATATSGSLVHHNAAFGNVTDFDVPSDFQLWISNRSADPRFVDRAAGNFALSQTEAGQPATSALVDAGGSFVHEVDVSGSTRSDGVADSGVVDLGHHAGAAFSEATPGGNGPGAIGSGATLHVDCARGDDRRTRVEAGSAASPLLTIPRALSLAGAGDTVLVHPGTCTSPVTIDVAGVTLRAASPHASVLSPPTGATGLAVRASNVSVDGFVVRSSKEGVAIAARNAGEVLTRVRLSALRVEPLAGGGTIATNGIRAQDTDRVRIESCSVDGADQQGIVVKRGSRAWVRNNLITRSGEWGLHVDNGDPPAPATIAGQVVAFNTVVGSGRRAVSGGIRFQNATGEIRDNVLADNTGSGIRSDQTSTVVHHNLVSGSAVPFDRVGGSAAPHWANLTAAPLFVDPSARSFALRQVAAGDDATSPAVDAGSLPVATSDVAGSTRRDGVLDAGIADLGWHDGAEPLPAPPAVATPPGATTRRTLHVDAIAGDDARSAIDAQDARRAWRTIGRALAADGAGTGETVLVAPGTYAEAVQTTRLGVTLRAPSGATIVAPVAGIGIQIEHALTLVEGFTIRGGLHGVRAENALLSTIRGCTLEGQSGNGILVVQSDHVTIDGNRVAGVAAQGIVVKRAGFSYVRNNLVAGAGDWGIQIDNGDTPLPPVTGGHVLAFNTVYGSGHARPGSGGLRLQNATGEVRDNLLASNAGSGIKTDTVPTVVHHNAVSGSATRFDTKTGAEPFLWANVTQDPQLVDPAGGDFSLRQAAAGDGATSPAVDAGSGAVAARDVSGATRRDGVADVGVADIGFHSGAAPAGARPAPVPTPTTPPIPAAGSGIDLHVDPVAGDDARDLLGAQSPGTPWKTIGRAIRGADPGDVIVLAPGTYSESIDVSRHAITLRGAGALGDVVIAPPAGAIGIGIDGKSGVVLDNLAIEGGAQGVVANDAPGLTLRQVAVIAPAANGMQLTAAHGAVIDGCVVTGAGTQGMLLRRSGGLYVRNNLVYANTEWAITVDNTGAPLPAPVAGNVVAFNTVHANGMGIRLLNASGEVRDNQITAQRDLGLYLAGPELLAHHNNFSANGRDRDHESAFTSTIRVWANLGANPRYVKPAGNDEVLGGTGWKDDDFRLKQVGNQTPTSPLVDAGSGLAAALDIGGSTRSDGGADAGIADVGFHYGAPAAGTPPPFASPSNLQWTYYVSGSGGSDARSRATARSRTTPWLTIGHALQQAAAGDTVVVLPGTYAESLQIQAARLTLVADVPGTVVIVPPAATSANGVTIERASVTVDGLIVRDATNNGISVLPGLTGTTIRNCAILGAVAEGIRATTLDDILIEDSVVSGARASGILLRQVTGATVRNNLVYANSEWGISIDASAASGPAPAVSLGHVVERNTSAYNGTGNLRLANARGVIRDNLLTHTAGVGLRIDTAGSTLLHNGFHAVGRDVEPERYIVDSCAGCASNLYRDPLYLSPTGADGVPGGAGFADDDFRLAQTRAGQSPQSEAVDVGSGTVDVLRAGGSTASDGVPDAGVVDLGFHYGASSRAILPLPASSSAARTSAASVATESDDAHENANTETPAAAATLLRPSPTPAPASPPDAERDTAPTPRRIAGGDGTDDGVALHAARTLHVDHHSGDDARTSSDALSPDTAWRTIGRALDATVAGDVIVVAPGDYAEHVVVATDGVTLRGTDAGVRVVPPSRRKAAVRIRSAQDVTLQDIEVVGGVDGLVATGDAGGLRITGVTVAGAARHGIVLGSSGPVTIESTSVGGAGASGLVARATRELVVRATLFSHNAANGLDLRRAHTRLDHVVVEQSGGDGIRAHGGTLAAHDARITGNAGAAVVLTGDVEHAISDSVLAENGGA